MKLRDAQDKILRICNIPFSELFTEADFETIIKNKGKTGQLLELALGKKLDSFNIDFEDGELKSNKCDRNGKPLETVFITQIASVIDELLEERPFQETYLYEKISNMLYVPVFLQYADYEEACIMYQLCKLPVEHRRTVRGNDHS